MAPRDLGEEARARAEAFAAQGDLGAARRWADRLTRLSPADPNAQFLLAMICLQLQDRHCETVLAGLAASHDVREVWIGLVAIRRLHGDAAGAAQAAGQGLSRHAISPGMISVIAGLATQVRRPGWCGLTGDGQVCVGETAAAPALRLDGQPVRWRGTADTGRLPVRWASARWLSVRHGDADLLGSPIDLQAIRRLDGFVSLDDAGLTGWAWHPADPDRTPALTLHTPSGARPIRASDTGVCVTAAALLARPRGFTVPAALLEAAGGCVRVRDQDGRDLLGSPLYPGAEQRAAAALARYQAGEAAGAEFAWLPLPVLAAPARAITRAVPRGVSVVLIAEAAEAEATAAALRRLVATVAPDVPIILAPIRGHAASDARVTVLDPPDPAGWAAAANAGLRQAAGTDTVLLDATVGVTAGWLDHVRAVCLAAADIGTASPLEGAAAGAASAGVAIPLAREGLVYLRGDCLAQTGRLRAEMFPQGEGAMADFCLRAAALGWRHRAAPALVAPRPERPVRAGEAALAARNQALLARLHPGLEAMLAAPPAAALAAARRGAAAAFWRQGRRAAGAVLLVAHADGGGVERHVRARASLWRAAGKRAVVLRPAPRGDGPGWCVAADTPAPNATEGAQAGGPRFRLPGELTELAALLRDDRPELIEVHHLLGHDHTVLDLARLLQIPYDVFIHDHAWFCPRILLVGRERRYCGEPELAGCQACVADLGSCLEEDISVADLRLRSAADLAGARRVVAPSQDTATRLRRRFPAVAVTVVAWEDDSRVTTGAVPLQPATRVCVVGAIGVEKGFELLLDCARDAAARRLALEFVLVGHSIDDARLLDTGRVFVTGAYREAEAVTLIGAQAATLGFIPSLWPETWCYTLSHIWAAGLHAAAFDIGAPAERIRRSGQGTVFPLGLQPSAVNQALLAYAAELGNDPPPGRTRGRVKTISQSDVLTQSKKRARHA